jgi:hypothetical protein
MYRTSGGPIQWHTQAQLLGWRNVDLYGMPVASDLICLRAVCLMSVATHLISVMSVAAGLVLLVAGVPHVGGAGLVWPPAAFSAFLVASGVRAAHGVD